MATAWDNFQELMKAEMEKVYSPSAVNYMMDPINIGRMPDADVHVSVSGTCGDNMEMWLKITGDEVEKISFCTNGCGATIACGCMVTELVKGKSMGEALGIGAEVIVQRLGGLPEDHIHCAGLASLTLKKAIITYLILPKKTGGGDLKK